MVQVLCMHHNGCNWLTSLFHDLQAAISIPTGPQDNYVSQQDLFQLVRLCCQPIIIYSPLCVCNLLSSSQAAGSTEPPQCVQPSQQLPSFRANGANGANGPVGPEAWELLRRLHTLRGLYIIMGWQQRPRLPHPRSLTPLEGQGLPQQISYPAGLWTPPLMLTTPAAQLPQSDMMPHPPGLAPLDVHKQLEDMRQQLMAFHYMF